MAIPVTTEKLAKEPTAAAVAAPSETSTRTTVRVRPPVDVQPVGGPVPTGWREGTLTRAKELEALCEWVLACHPRDTSEILVAAIRSHLAAAREAATAVRLNPRRRLPRSRSGSLLERAMSNIDAAEAHLLNIAPPSYVVGQIACVQRHVQCHLVPGDPRRRELESIVERLNGHPSQPSSSPSEEGLARQLKIIEQERGKVVSAMRAASSAALREQVRVRTFRNVLVVTTVLMSLLAIGIAGLGWLWPTAVPLCFAPEESGQAVVVCPTAQSARFPTSPQPGTNTAAGTALQDVDDFVKQAATRHDLFIVELVGLAAAAVAAAAAIRGFRGSSERHGLLVALAAIKLPTGAVTAFLGLLLMRGQFVPGLSALDTSAQILAWALVFGYAQQLFTRMVDRQGQVVLESVRGANNPQPTPSPP